MFREVFIDGETKMRRFHFDLLTSFTTWLLRAAVREAEWSGVQSSHALQTVRLSRSLALHVVLLSSSLDTPFVLAR